MSGWATIEICWAAVTSGIATRPLYTVVLTGLPDWSIARSAFLALSGKTILPSPVDPPVRSSLITHGSSQSRSTISHCEVGCKPRVAKQVLSVSRPQ